MEALKMAFRRSILKQLILATAVCGSAPLFAEEAAISAPPSTNDLSTNVFYTNNAAEKRRQNQPFERVSRDSGLFNPLKTEAPKGFGGNAPTFTPGFLPRPAVPIQKPEEDKKDDWIFNKPGETTAEDVFKVNHFGTDKDKKSESGFQKYIANDSDKHSDTRAGRQDFSRNSDNSNTESRDTRDTRENRGSQSSFNGMRPTETLRDFTSRDMSRENRMENRTDSFGRSSVFGDFFGGDRNMQARWAEQSIARRNEFQQMFETRSASDLGLGTPAATAVAAGAVTDFTRPAQSSFSDPYQNQSLSRSTSFDQPNFRQQQTLGGSSSISAPTETRPQYQPATLPFPRRPGELFK